MNEFGEEDIQKIMQLAMAEAGGGRVGDIVDELPNIKRILEPLDPIETAAAVGGLLAQPEIQSNCLRLEALSHLAICFCKGNRKPSGQQLSQLFEMLGRGSLGQSEDPAEDVFVSSIYTPRGNFRILEGVWESSGFFLQRVVNVVNRMPNGDGYNELRESVYGLLKLSDAVCERAGLVRYQLGSHLPERLLPKKFTGSITRLQRCVSFSEDDLKFLGILPSHLSGYLFGRKLRDKLPSDEIGNSSLERCPLILTKSTYYLMLPTAVGAAIRRNVFEEMLGSGLKGSFLRALSEEYSGCLEFTPIILDSGLQVRFSETRSGVISGLVFEVDKGRYLSLAFYMDSLEGFESDGLMGFNPSSASLAGELGAWFDHSSAEAENDKGFIEGVFLVVECGVGRGSFIDISDMIKERWHTEAVSAPDFVTMSWAKKFNATSLFRILSSIDKLEEVGVHLQNVNGLLNIVAWASALDGHLVPHGDLPDDFMVEGGAATIVIQQNSLRDLRHEVLTTWDLHVERFIDGGWFLVQKEGRSFFEEDAKEPLYVATEMSSSGSPFGVYKTLNRAWWFMIDSAPAASKIIAYERWRMLSVWISRAASVVEERISGIPEGPILCEVIFSGVFSGVPMAERFGLDQALSDISVIAVPSDRTIKITVGDGFEKAIFNEENVAERALVVSLIKGVSMLASEIVGEEDALAIAGSIVVGPHARQMHAFRARSFRDYVFGSIEMEPLLINLDDDAAHRLNLGWRNRERSQGCWVHGKQDCVTYLNGIVASIEDDLCANLRRFERSETLHILLNNYESIDIDRERWRRTSAAAISLRRDSGSARKVISLHESKLSAASLACRIVIEMAICECPLGHGAIPGVIDISRLLVRAASLYQFGGWSDAIRWDSMEPRLRITSLGDIHANHDFIDEIISPFANVTDNARIDSYIESYDENLEDRQAEESVHGHIEPEFLSAWLDETGASIDDIRVFVDFIEGLGVSKNKAVFEIKKSLISKNISVGGLHISDESSAKIVEFLIFRSRESWRAVPDEFDRKDINPWRFRRRLTILRRPLIQIDENEDPGLIVAPGVLRDAVVYMLQNYHRGDFPSWQLGRKMSRWSGKSADQRGNKFSGEVAKLLEGFGWKVCPEVKLTKLLRKSFERDFGDVDVLAWNEGAKRILIIECKDVQFRKTYGEIAEQLSDFRGEIRFDGKPDYLLRHLERVEIIGKNPQELLQFIKWVRGSEFELESHLVFRNPVPMKFALEKMAERVQIHFFDRMSGFKISNA